MDRFVSSSCRFAAPGQKPLGMSVYRSVYPSSTAHPLEMPQSHSHLQFIKEEDYYFGTPHLANPCSLAFLGNEASHSTSNYVDHHHMLGSLPSTSIKQNSIIHAATARNNMVKSNPLSCYETLTAEHVEASNSSRLETPQVFDGTPLSREWYSKSECFGGNGVETFTRDYPPQGFGRAMVPDMYHLPLKKQHTSQALYCLWMDHCLDEGSKKPCNRVFHQLDDLVNHLSVDHVNINYSNGYECRWKDCDRGELPFKERYRLVNHLRVHTGEKPFQCPFSACRKRFSRPENMKIHIRTHTGEKPFPCEFAGCGRRFANSSDRKKHSHVHRSDKPYLCGTRECKKRYTDPSSLRKHMKLHEPGPITPLPAHDDMFFSC